MGIISAVMNMISPSGSMKKQLLTLIGMAALLSVINSFSPEGFRLSLEDVDISSDIEFENSHTCADVSEIFLEEAKIKYDEYFTVLLNNNDISGAKVNTKLQLTGDNELDITEVEVVLADISHASLAESIIAAEVGGTYVNIRKAEDEETAAASD